MSRPIDDAIYTLTVDDYQRLPLADRLAVDAWLDHLNLRSARIIQYWVHPGEPLEVTFRVYLEDDNGNLIVVDDDVATHDWTQEVSTPPPLIHADEESGA